MALLSQRAYAKHRRLSESAIRNAIKRGQITRNKQNKIDPVLADKQWDDYTKRKMPHAQTSKHPDSPTSNTKPTTPHIYIENVIIQVPALPFEPNCLPLAEEEKQCNKPDKSIFFTHFFRALGGK